MLGAEEIRAAALPWARDRGVEALFPAGPSGGFRDDPCVDFGKLIERVPAVVLRPRGRDALVACVGFLADHGIPWKARGAGHCSGGQALIEGGAVIDTRHLDRVVADDPDGDEITVEGGAWWLALMHHLHPQGRRPLVLTDNLRTSVAGTLATGGFGDTTHIHGPQIEAVTGMTLVTPDGSARRVAPGDELFDWSLAGGGRLGVIADVALRTLRRPRALSGSLIEWDELPRFLEDAQLVRALRLYEFFRVTLRWGPPIRIAAIAAHFSDTTVDDRATLAHLRADRARPLPASDRFLHALADPIEAWDYACPALELVLPLPDGRAALEAIVREVAASGLAAHLPLGSALVLFAPGGRFPLAPYPRAPLALLLVLRPQLRGRDEALSWLPLLRALAGQALAAGGRIYGVSIDLGLEAVDARLEALARGVDPRGLCRSGRAEVL